MKLVPDGRASFLSDSFYNRDFYIYWPDLYLINDVAHHWAWSLELVTLCVVISNAGSCVAKFNSDIVVVLIIQEIYADFVAIDPYHFTLNVPSNYIYMLPAVVDPSALQRFCDRVVDGIAAVFLALKRRPVIRYQRTSDIAKRIAQEAAVSSSHAVELK